jgi:hypothetical protein
MTLHENAIAEQINGILNEFGLKKQLNRFK